MVVDETFNCVNVFTSCEGSFPLSNLLEICLHEPKSVLLIFCERWRCVYLVISVVLAVLHVLQWVWVAGPSGVDVINILIEAVGVAGVSSTSSNHERQSAALLQTPDIHSNVIL